VRRRTDFSGGEAQIVFVAVRDFRPPVTQRRSRQSSRRKPMGTNKDQVDGRIKEAKGTINEAAGKLVGNEKLQLKGKVQKVLGEAQSKYGDIKEDVKDAKHRA
jgi:uncharacterized protein YjbJ (UPF0337 family)